jgi:hypothetical protein
VDHLEKHQLLVDVFADLSQPGFSCLVWRSIYVKFPCISSVSAYSLTVIVSVLSGAIEGTAHLANGVIGDLRVPRQANELWFWNPIKA